LLAVASCFRSEPVEKIKRSVSILRFILRALRLKCEHLHLENLIRHQLSGDSVAVLTFRSFELRLELFQKLRNLLLSHARCTAFFLRTRHIMLDFHSECPLHCFDPKFNVERTATLTGTFLSSAGVELTLTQQLNIVVSVFNNVLRLTDGC